MVVTSGPVEEEEVLSVELEVTELLRRMNPLLDAVVAEVVCAEECEEVVEVAQISEVTHQIRVTTNGGLPQIGRILREWSVATQVKPKCLTRLASKIQRSESRWVCKDPGAKK